MLLAQSVNSPNPISAGHRIFASSLNVRRLLKIPHICEQNGRELAPALTVRWIGSSSGSQGSEVWDQERNRLGGVHLFRGVGSRTLSLHLFLLDGFGFLVDSFSSGFWSVRLGFRALLLSV